MRAVWSHWSKPLKSYPGSVWLSTKHYLMAFVLSFKCASQHYLETAIVTDDEGVEILVDWLGLEFNHVSTELNLLNEHDYEWWNLGKLYAYKAQREAFIHLDNDVFLWKALPPKLASSQVFAQNYEYFIEEKDYYIPDDFERAINVGNETWLPEEWWWCRKLLGSYQKSINTGIYGGQRVDFINYCAELTIRIIEHQSNRQALSKLNNKTKHTGMLEMYIPNACIEYHRNREDSLYKSIDINLLFRDPQDAYTKAKEIGYTHMIGYAKRNKYMLQCLERKVRNEYPSYYKKCIEYVDEQGEFYYK